MGAIKIISDGTGFGTKVVDEATGEPITNITRVEWVVAADGVAMVNLRAIKVPVEVVGDGRVIDVCIFDRDQKCNPTPRLDYSVELTPGVGVPRPTVKPLEFSPTAFIMAVPEVDFQDRPSEHTMDAASYLSPTFKERLDSFTQSCDEKLQLAIKGITTEAQARRHGRWLKHLHDHGHCGEAMCSVPCRLAEADVEATRADIAKLTITVDTPGIKEHVDRMASMANTAIKGCMELAGRMDKAREALNAYGAAPTPDNWIALCEIITPTTSGSPQE